MFNAIQHLEGGNITNNKCIDIKTIKDINEIEKYQCILGRISQSELILRYEIVGWKW